MSLTPAQTSPKPLKTIRSHTGYSRFLFGELECDAEGMPITVREIPRPANIPSPYHYSPMWQVNRWKGREVVVRETSHKTYQVFSVEDISK